MFRIYAEAPKERWAISGAGERFQDGDLKDQVSSISCISRRWQPEMCQEENTILMPIVVTFPLTTETFRLLINTKVT